MPMAVFALLVRRRGVLPGLLVLPVRVMMGRLMVMVRGGVVVRGGLMVMLDGRMFRLCHGLVLHGFGEVWGTMLKVGLMSARR